MTAGPYVVQMPNMDASPARDIVNGVDSVVVWANDATEALAVAKTAYEAIGGNINALWDAGTATAVAAGADFTGFEVDVYVRTASPTPGPQKLAVSTVPVKYLKSAVQHSGAAGTGYTTGDIVAVATAVGTHTRVAKFKVTASAGAVTALELVDPGDYSVFPGTLTAIATSKVTGSGDDALTIDVVIDTTLTYNGLLAKTVSLLNGLTGITHAALDLSAAGRLLTIAGTSDALGDKTFDIAMMKNGVAFPNYFSTQTEGGMSSAALTVALPTAALALVVPTLVAKLRRAQKA
jgi:hypothetical protein